MNQAKTNILEQKEAQNILLIGAFVDQQFLRFAPQAGTQNLYQKQASMNSH